MLWIILAIPLLVCSITLWFVRVTIRQRFFTAFFTMFGVGFSIGLLTYGIEEIAPWAGSSQQDSPLCAIMLLTFFSFVVGLGAQWRLRLDRAMWRSGKMDILPNWMKKLSRYWFDVDD